MLEQAGVTLNDVSFIALPKEDLQFLVNAVFTAFNSPQLEVRDGKQLAALNFKREFGVDVSEKLYFVPHHLCHLWSAYGLSGFDSSLVVSLDGGGADARQMGFDFGMVGVGKGPKLEVNAHLPEHALIAGALLRSNDPSARVTACSTLFDDYKVMGPAPYGDATRFKTFFDRTYRLKFGGRVETMGELELLKAAVDNGLLEHLRRKGQPFTQAHKDLAAGIQNAFEKMYFQVINH